MKLASVVWPTTVSDFPAQSAALRKDISSFMFSWHHIQDELNHPAEVPYIIEALTAILGDDDAVRERHLYSVIYCTLAPLVHEGGMCDAYLELCQFDVPICVFPMPCAGSTGLASLFSNIAMGNAEALSAQGFRRKATVNFQFQKGSRHANIYSGTIRKRAGA